MNKYDVIGTVAICKGFIGKFDAMKISHEYNKNVRKNPAAEIVNWHEFSNLLDYMATVGLVKRAGHNNSGMTQYTWKDD